MFEIISTFHKRLTASTVGKNTMYSLAGLGGRFVLKSLYFIILARILGPAGFGVFSGALGLIYVFYPFVDLGSGLLMIRAVSRQPQAFSKRWGSALTVILVVGVFLCGISVLLAWIILSPHVAFFVVLPTAIGVLWGFRVTELAGQAFQAHQKMQHTSAVWVSMGVLRLLAALIFIGVTAPKSVEKWAMIFMISELLGGFLTILWVRRELGGGRLGVQGLRGELWDGLTFSVGVAAGGVYNDFDKTLLVRLSDQAIAGAYSAAYRFLDAIFIPVQAIITSTFPKFFQVGRSGTTHAWGYTKRLLPYGMSTALIAWGGMVVLSPILPELLGEEYKLTSMIAIWLGPVLVFRSAHNLLANCLSGSNHQGLRSIIQMIIAFVNLILNLWWIPLYGWLGALWSSILSDGMLMVFLLVSILLLKTREGNNAEKV